jgi:hypothetical protein
MAGYTETTTDTFEKVGDYDHVMDMSGQRSRYTMPVERQGPTTPDMGGGNGSARKGATEIHEAHGPTFRPVATRGFAEPYPATGRGIRTVPSSVGNRDFWDRRSGQGGEVIGD